MFVPNTFSFLQEFGLKIKIIITSLNIEQFLQKTPKFHRNWSRK